MYVYACALSCVQLFATSWTVTQQAPLSIGFPRQEYWSGLPLPSRGDLSSPHLLYHLHWQGILYQLSHQGSSFINCNKHTKLIHDVNNRGKWL